MRFAWDQRKASSNLVKHSVSFEEGFNGFGDPFSNTFPDQDHSIEEQRFIIIGLSDQGTILVVAHTDDGELVRIISAREATQGEKKSYEES
jgi:uncharacterized DUF497 family protein